MKTDSQLKDYIKSHKGLTVNAVQNNLGRHHIPSERIRRLMIEVLGRDDGTKPASPRGILVQQDLGKAGQQQPAARTPARVRPKSLEEFRRAHDNPQKIRNGLASLTGSSYLTEEEFRIFCNIPAQLWRRNAELPEFVDNKLKHAGVVHWASAATINEMKSIIGSA